MYASCNPDRRVERGLCLVEALSMTAIVLVVTAMALPLYQYYAARNRVAEVLDGADAILRRVSSYYRDEGRWPGDEAMTAMPAGGRYVSRVEIRQLPYRVLLYLHNTGDTAANGRVLEFRPHAGLGMVEWECGTARDPALALPRRYVPYLCH